MKKGTSKRQRDLFSFVFGLCCLINSSIILLCKSSCYSWTANVKNPPIYFETIFLILGVPHVLFFLPSYAHSLNLDVDAATLLAVISVFDLLGRVCFGFLADTNYVPKFVMYSSLIFLSSVSIILLPLFNDAVSLFVILSCYGLGVGGWFLMVPVLLADFFGVERIGASYGLARLFQSTSNLLGPILAGLIRDQTGSFR